MERRPRGISQAGAVSAPQGTRHEEVSDHRDIQDEVGSANRARRDASEARRHTPVGCGAAPPGTSLLVTPDGEGIHDVIGMHGRHARHVAADTWRRQAGADAHGVASRVTGLSPRTEYSMDGTRGSSLLLVSGSGT